MKRSVMNLRAVCVMVALCAAGCGPVGDEGQQPEQTTVTKQSARALARQRQQDPNSGNDPDPTPATGQDVCAAQGWYNDGECDEFCDSPDPDCQGCRSDSDCSSADVCVDHMCLPTGACAADADCAIGLVCDAGACALPAADVDGDGIPNTTDNCPTVANADQADSDRDGVGDACDTPTSPGTCTTDADCAPSGGCVRGMCQSLGPGDADADADGVPDAVDNCPTTANPDQADADFDGIGDACDTPSPASCTTDADCSAREACVRGICLTQNPSQSDTDGDGIPDAQDNCPRTPNADQLDSDRNGVGDACDSPAPPSCAAHSDCAASEICQRNLCVPGSRQDTDGDGIIDIQDNCPTTANADQADADFDGIGDACDNSTVTYCRSDAECAPGQSCVRGVCMAP